MGKKMIFLCIWLENKIGEKINRTHQPKCFLPRPTKSNLPKIKRKCTAKKLAFWTILSPLKQKFFSSLFFFFFFGLFLLSTFQ